MKTLLMLALLMVSCCASAAEFKVSNLGLSVSDVKEMCGRSDDECFDYFVGAINGFEVAFTVFQDAQRRAKVSLKLIPYCLPEGITRQNIYEASKQYLLSHPDPDKFDAASIIVAGLAKAYPCQKP